MTRQQYITHQRQHGHPSLKVSECGLFISSDNPWLAASLDGMVNAPSHTAQPLGLLEVKKPYTSRDQTLIEACKKSTFSLKEDDGSFSPKRSHDYYHQVQAQLYCAGRQWCDFVLRTNKDLHIERIEIDKPWQEKNIQKLKDFYFSSLLSEFAYPRYHRGGIREPTNPANQSSQ